MSEGSITALVETLVQAGATPELILAAVRTAEAQKDAAIAQAQDAAEDGREKARARWRKWWDRLGLSASEWRDLSNAVKARDNFACVYCGSSEEPLHADHVIPLIQGGTNDLDNLATACRECNCSKSGRSPDQWLGVAQ